MKQKFLLFFLLCGLFANSQNIEVSGIQSGVWDADTVFVIDNVIVEDNLDIMAGTTVLFDGYYSITVGKNAAMNAIGTYVDSIVFTVTDTTGFHVYNMGRGGWNGIRLEKAMTSKFEYCRFQYGKAALDDDQDGGAIRIFSCDEVEINHSTLYCNFSREHGGAVNAENSKVTIYDCEVKNNLLYSEVDTIYYMYGGGLRFLKCEVDITNTDFRFNIGQGAIGGALCLDSCTVNIDRCRFEYNYGINGAGLYLIRSNHLERGSIANALFANNISGHFGGGLAISDSSPIINNLTVVNNHSIGVNCGGIFFYQNCSPLVRNCIVYGNTNEVPLEEPVQIWSWTNEGFAPEFYNCLIQYGLDNISNHEAISIYEDCLDVNPGFVNPEDEDFHLTENSPCIDAGLTYEGDFYGYDLDGNVRVSGNQIDLGAYEFSSTSLQETTQNESLIRIISNPVTASSYVEIEAKQGGMMTARLYSLDGKLLDNKNLGVVQKGTNRFDILGMFSSLSSGTYIVVFNTIDQIFTIKAIKY